MEVAVTEPAYAKALSAFIRPGDCLVVWKLDRLGRSLPHLLATVTDLQEARRRLPFSDRAQNGHHDAPG